MPEHGRGARPTRPPAAIPAEAPWGWGGACQSAGPCGPCCHRAVPAAGAGRPAEFCSSRDVTLRGLGRFAFVEASSEWLCEIKMF